MTEFDKGFEEKQKTRLEDSAKRLLHKIIQPDQYIGDVYSIGYENALVQIHDFYRQKVGGIPHLCFLIGIRFNLEEKIDYKLEDSSIILLRVMGPADLPDSEEAKRIRVQSAQEVSGEINKHWDHQEAMDAQTHNLLSYAGVTCKVIGTFYLELDEDKADLALRFGSDISNYYPNKGLKVYKPNEEALATIVNYDNPDTASERINQTRVPIGKIRYASTNRPFQGVSNVEVSISPADLLHQKTALFGMTRTGKSNTTKIIAKSVFDLRFSKDSPLQIGQIIFDPNGEYANENVQDENKEKNPAALKNVWQTHSQGKEKDVVTYGIHEHPKDPNRKLMLINFFEMNMLQTGKEIINEILRGEDSQYFKNFIQVRFDEPKKENFDDEDEFFSERTRFRRRKIAYQGLLNKAGFDTPPNLNKPNLKGLFKKELLTEMQNISLGPKNKKKEQVIKLAAETLTKETPSWDSLNSAFEGLSQFIKQDAYKNFNSEYIKKSKSGEGWADADYINILEMYNFTKGTNLIGKARNQHTINIKVDFAQEIYTHLTNGRLVIIDQSSGEPEVNDSSARRIMWEIFRSNQEVFRKGGVPPSILIYIEEAHNLLPHGSDMDLKDVWVRTAKEGGKYYIGMVYVTQEVSSIQKNILKNSANWFIGHLNNTDETREIRKFYDFEDFEKSIRRAQDKGFIRVKTLSNLFSIPVQIKKFEV